MKDLINELEKARKEFISLVNNFPLEKRELVLFDEWNLKNILSHLSGWGAYQTDALKQLKSGEKIKPSKNLKASINDAFVFERKDWDWDMVYKEFFKLSQQLVNEYRNLSKELWRESIYENKKETVEDFIKIEIIHLNKTHTSQIKSVLKSI